MFQRKGKRLFTSCGVRKLALTLVSTAIIVWVTLRIRRKWDSNVRIPLDTTSSGSCVIPDIPLRSKTYNKTVPGRHMISECSDDNKIALPRIQFADNGTLELLSSDSYKKEDCTAFEILRPQILPSDTHVLWELEPFDSMNQIHSVTAEYVMVACRHFWTNTLQYSYRSRLLTNTDAIKRRVDHWDDDKGQGLPVNVVLLVLDSTSSTDASRHLPLTINFLKTQLNFIQFHKFHALGEPTMMNVMPMLTGTSARDTFEYHHWRDPWDDNYFIWKDFQNAHYVTSYIEDVPYVGTFNYGFQAGFVSPPTDVYPRPLFTAWEMNKKESNKCVGETSLWKLILDMELEMLQNLEGIAPVFSIPWLTWPFHDHFGSLSLLDTDLLNFFQNLTSTPSILENTVFIVMADHGFYAHEYSETHEGLLERRLPLFLIRIPEKLNQLLPNVSAIVSKNSEVVTSHYDVYKTLFHLSKMATMDARGNKVKETKADACPGQSIFEPLPPTRTCNDAQIPESWCACNLPPPPPPFSTQTVIPNAVLLNVEPFHSLRIKDFIG